MQSCCKLEFKSQTKFERVPFRKVNSMGGGCQIFEYSYEHPPPLFSPPAGGGLFLIKRIKITLLRLQRSGRTIGAVAGDHKISIRWLKFLRQINDWDRKILKTEGVLAGRTVKVGVHIIGIGTRTVFGTKPIFCTSAFIVYLMDHSVLLKRFQRAIECGAVRVRKVLFQISKTHRGFPFSKIVKYHQPHRRWLNASGFKSLLCCIRLHIFS